MLSQGTSFTFSGAAYTVTRVSVNLQWEGNNRPKISTAHLGSSINAEEPFTYGFIPYSDDSASTVEVDFLGGSPISIGSTGNIVISGAAGGTYNGATCVSSSVTAAVGDLVRGSATFRIKA